jgi:hypothetical protein
VKEDREEREEKERQEREAMVKEGRKKRKGAVEDAGYIKEREERVFFPFFLQGRKE